MRPIHALLALLLAIATSSCATDGTAPRPAVKLVISPNRLTLTDTSSSATVSLAASGTGGVVAWRVATSPDWLVISPAEGTIGDQPVELTVSAPGLPAMEPGTLQGGVDFIANRSGVHLFVTAEIAPAPLASISDTLLTLPATSDTASFVLRNSGRGRLLWIATASIASLAPAPAIGSLGTGEEVTVRVTVDKEPLPAGTTRAQLTIASNSLEGDVTFPVTIEVAPAPDLRVTTTRLVFPNGTTQRELYLYNAGKGPLDWSAAPDRWWVAVLPTGGEIQDGDSARIVATIDPSALLAAADSTARIAVTANGLVPRIDLAVVATSSSPFPLGLTVLDHRVIDAEYSAAAGLIVTVSTDPARLNVLDPATGAVAHVPLALPPTSVAVSPDGAYAAVGHDSLVSHVDLIAKTVVRTWPVTTDVVDIALGPNGWAYATASLDSWSWMWSLDVATGEQRKAEYAYANAGLRLHPSGRWLYAAWNGLTPDNTDRYDIRGGAAVLMWHSPYWGEHDFGGRLWFSADGARLYTRSGNVFTAADHQSEDMVYVATMWILGSVESAADSRRYGRVYVAESGSPMDLRLFDSSSFGFEGVVPLPVFTGPGGPVPAVGRYVFVPSEGDRVYVLVQADPAAGLPNDWALVVMDPATMP